MLYQHAHSSKLSRRVKATTVILETPSYPDAHRGLVRREPCHTTKRASVRLTRNSGAVSGRRSTARLLAGKTNLNRRRGVGAATPIHRDAAARRSFTDAPPMHLSSRSEKRPALHTGDVFRIGIACATARRRRLT